jgi:CheY-like chemotaxis protein
MEKKVLLIDDEASLRRSVSVGLMQKGYQTEPCENGMKALQTLETFRKKKVPLDCAIVDIKLPDIDGLKLLKVIKFNYPQLPVIIITGYGNEVVADEAKDRGCLPGEALQHGGPREDPRRDRGARGGSGDPATTPRSRRPQTVGERLRTGLGE